MILSHTILLIAGAICLLVALALVFWPRWVASVPAFVGMLLMHLSYTIDVPKMILAFWGIATLITAGLYYLSPRGEPDGHKSSNLFIGLTSLAGGMLGILLESRILLLGVVLGAAIGQLAYSRTPSGKWLMQSHDVFLRYFAAKCLPTIVAISIVCISIMGIVIE
jgi:hypothetical protein